jgi:23S rRNA-/tRNA-specific pseudouridylate synthase
MLADMWQWYITDFEAGHQLLDALALRVPAAPRAFLRQLIRKGRVRCGNRAATAEMPVTSGLCLEVQVNARFSELAAGCGVPPQELLFEDQHTLVLYKPAGLALHRATGQSDDLVTRANHFAALRHAPYRLAPVHRLDIGTSGPVLFGKGRRAAGQYGRLLMAGQISKHYLALVAGRVTGEGELSTPVAEGTQLKPALTRYRSLAAGNWCSLLELDLVTGRRHQARQHLADAGWPIVRDRRYGGPPWPGLDHPFLHCHVLRFPSLEADTIRQVNCPLPPPLAAILAAAGLAATTAAAASRENSPPSDGKPL